MLGVEMGRIEILTGDSSSDNPYASVCADFAERIRQMGLRNVKI